MLARQAVEVVCSRLVPGTCAGQRKEHVETKLWTVLALGLLLAPLACSGQTAPRAPAALTEEQKTPYALGLMLGGNLKPLKLTPAEIEAVKKGLTDAATGATPEVDLAAYQAKVQEFARGRARAQAEVEKSGAKAFADRAAQEPGAVRTSTGLVFRTLNPGAGASPTADSTVKAHYEGKLANGTVFDSSIKRGEPVDFPLRGVIPCWTEGVQRMKVGETAQLVCPSDIAYGDQGRPPLIPGGATLVFEVQLLGIKE